MDKFTKCNNFLKAIFQITKPYMTQKKVDKFYLQSQMAKQFIITFFQKFPQNRQNSRPGETYPDICSSPKTGSFTLSTAKKALGNIHFFLQKKGSGNKLESSVCFGVSSFKKVLYKSSHKYDAKKRAVDYARLLHKIPSGHYHLIDWLSSCKCRG